MTKPLSVDLRSRVVAAVYAGLSRRQAAARFGVSISSAIRWTSRVRTTGGVRPLRVGGDKRSSRIEGFAPVILGAVDTKPDITLAELRELLAEHEASSAPSTIWRFFAHTRSRSKKSAHAAEQERPDVLARRRASFDRQLDLDSERLILIDEPKVGAQQPDRRLDQDGAAARPSAAGTPPASHHSARPCVDASQRGRRI